MVLSDIASASDISSEENCDHQGAQFLPAQRNAPASNSVHYDIASSSGGDKDELTPLVQENGSSNLIHNDAFPIRSSFVRTKNRMTITNFPAALANGIRGKRLANRMMTISKFIKVSSEDFLIDDEEKEGSNDNAEDCQFPELALVFFFKTRQWDIVDPNRYLQAASEVISVTLAICWIITLILNPQCILNNPLKDRLGYSDLCVGWDVYPANVVGCIGATLGAYFALKFIETNDQRMVLLVDSDKLSVKVQFLGRMTSRSFAVAVMCMPVIFVVPPTVSVWGHSLPFMMYIVSSAFVVFGRFAMFQDELTRIKAIYFVAYITLSLLFPFILICEYAYYDKHGEKSPWPAIITCVIDYSWFGLLSILSFMLPRDIVLVTSVKLGVREAY